MIYLARSSLKKFMALPLFVYCVQLVLIAECNKKERNLVDFVMTVPQGKFHYF